MLLLQISGLTGCSQATIGCEFFAKTIELPERRERPVKLLIWDTAGQEVSTHPQHPSCVPRRSHPLPQVFRSFTPNFLRGALAGIIVYDITSNSAAV